MNEIANIEFYNTPEGDVMMKELGRPAVVLDENNRPTIECMLSVIRDRYPKAHTRLMQIYSSSTMNRWYYEKHMYRFTLGRLLYAVEHEVSPDSIKGIVIMTEDSKPVLMTRGDYCKKVIIPFRHSSSQRDLVQRYREAVRIAEVMIDFYEKSDMEEMTSAFTTYESKIKGYMYSGGFTNSQDVIKEAWQSIITRVISGVCEKKLFTIDPYNYLRRCVRSYFCERKRERMALVGTPERRKGQITYDEILEML